MTSEQSKDNDNIHQYNKRYEYLLKKLVGNRNEKPILDFDEHAYLSEKLSLPRRLKLIEVITSLDKLLNKNFKDIQVQDLKRVILDIEKRDDYSVWTKHSYAVISKKFFSWLSYGEDYRERIKFEGYPELVRWINTTIKNKDKPKIKASDILTEEEVKRILQNCHSPKAKTFISLLYELGARISEIGNLRIKDITNVEYGYKIDLNGKTGIRTCLIILSAPYLTDYLNSHPFKNNEESYLWVNDYNKEKMNYPSFSKMLERAVSNAGIKKRIHPHLFRHSRLTHVLVNGEMTETQAKVYFGWIQDTKMLSNYSHLTSEDVNKQILKNNGLLDENEKTKEQKFKTCHICREINPTENTYCKRCSAPLEYKQMLALQQRRTTADEITAKVIEKLRSFISDEIIAKAVIEAEKDMGVGKSSQQY